MDSGADRSRRERRKSRRAYFSRDRFIQFNLVNATSVTASLLTTHVALSTVAPPLNLVLPFQNLSLSLSLFLRPPSKSKWSLEFVGRPYRLISLATGTGGRGRETRVGNVSRGCQGSRARRNVPCRLLYSCILSRLLPRLCSTVGGFACGAHRNEKVGEGREVLISTRGVN